MVLYEQMEAEEDEGEELPTEQQGMDEDEPVNEDQGWVFEGDEGDDEDDEEVDDGPPIALKHCHIKGVTCPACKAGKKTKSKEKQ